jgi:hypothetical protein
MLRFLDRLKRVCSVFHGRWQIFAPRDGPAWGKARTIGSGLARSPSNRIGLPEELPGKIA